jgi:hypothetical protein
MRILCIALTLAVSLSVPLLAAKTKSPAVFTGTYSTFTPKGNVRNFTTVVPQGSKITYADGFNETTYTASIGSAKIRIRALYSKDPDISGSIHEKKWELRGIDPSARIIIDSEPITLKETGKGTLLVYQYKNAKKHTPVIQRTLILSKGQFIYIMDCVAPIRDFYAYEQAFNIAMGGFLVTDEAFVPSEKAIQPSSKVKTEQEKKPEIVITQKELDSMGLKEEDRGKTIPDENAGAPQDQAAKPIENDSAAAQGSAGEEKTPESQDKAAGQDKTK